MTVPEYDRIYNVIYKQIKSLGKTRLITNVQENVCYRDSIQTKINPYQ